MGAMIYDRLPMSSVPQCASLLNPLVSEEDGSPFEDQEECAVAAAGGGAWENNFLGKAGLLDLCCALPVVSEEPAVASQVMCSETSWWG